MVLWNLVASPRWFLKDYQSTVCSGTGAPRSSWGSKTPRHMLEGKMLEFRPQLDSVGLPLGWEADNEQLSRMTRARLETRIGGEAEQNPFHLV